ncbi:MAG: bifunctional 5,10-methylenetetrahydrofolate dehydrogenase/5,10-methenyltetrahydrofolate cyclohydrolase [Halobacteriovoraceae bacterium]|nr:bifunctional 5,10-methylenetetrahydrofolate dehydrogenase/5,10-methenyltetrahydrofolate cyclohydrolase [Halobacteriovoraceae bacterium]
MTIEMKAKDVIEKNLPILTRRVTACPIPPFLKVILVGKNPSSLAYVGHKKKMCDKVGAKCEIVELPESVGEGDFLKNVEQINNDPQVTGFLIQMPLPSQLSHLDVYSLVKPTKDVDGFHIDNFKELYDSNVTEKTLLPCTPKGVIKLLDHYQVELEGKDVVIIGRSHIVGKPLFHLMNNRNATVTLCHSKTKELKEKCQRADIIVAAIGKPQFVDSTFVSPTKKQIFVDVGISRLENGRLVGDIDFESVMKKNPEAITPVPGGVGPMTVYSLIENLLSATEKQVK